MEFRKVGAIAAVLLTIPMALAAETQDTPERPTVTVRTFNYFGVSASDLKGARRQAGDILREAGIDVSWLDCFIARDAADGSPQCTQPLGATDLILRIGSANPSSGNQYVSMGFSLVNLVDGKAPYLATVYADLVTGVARGAGIDARELLGRAVAHEIGHLLLGTNQHASAGLMRAAWSRAELRRDKATDWHFLDGEARTMRATIAIRAAAH